FGFDHGHDVFFAHDHQFFAIHLDFSTAVLAEEDLVADLDVERTHCAVFEDLALADSQNFSVDRLLGGRIRDPDTAGGLTLLRFSFHDHAVMKRTHLHKRRLP